MKLANDEWQIITFRVANVGANMPRCPDDETVGLELGQGGQPTHYFVIIKKTNLVKMKILADFSVMIPLFLNLFPCMFYMVHGTIITF